MSFSSGGASILRTWLTFSRCRTCSRRRDVDRVLVVPCFLHPFAKELAPFEDRMAMCEAPWVGFPDGHLARRRRARRRESHAAHGRAPARDCTPIGRCGSWWAPTFARGRAVARLRSGGRACAVARARARVGSRLRGPQSRSCPKFRARPFASASRAAPGRDRRSRAARRALVHRRAWTLP